MLGRHRCNEFETRTGRSGYTHQTAARHRRARSEYILDKLCAHQLQLTGSDPNRATLIRGFASIERREIHLRTPILARDVPPCRPSHVEQNTLAQNLRRSCGMPCNKCAICAGKAREMQRSGAGTQSAIRCDDAVISSANRARAAIQHNHY
jgi:hypothetical protein